MPKYKLSADERVQQKSRKANIRSLLSDLDVKDFKDIQAFIQGPW